MLVHTTDQEPGIRRKGAGKGFFYLYPDGNKVRRSETLKRIASLAVPPAYRDVWICPLENGHLQATGRDTRERKQYRYHPTWHELQAREKFDRLATVGKGLPRLRRRVRADLQDSALSRERMVAAAVRLIDKLGYRVGNEAYLEENATRGISTLAKKNVTVDENSNEVEIEFVGKGGRLIQTRFSDGLVADVLSECHELPGQRLFSFQSEPGKRTNIDSGDINRYLAEVFEADITAKDLRTWRATVAATEFLRRIKRPRDRETEVRDAIRYAADEIGNRYETCRKHYVHPDLLATYSESGAWGISRLRPRDVAELQKSEALLLKVLT